MERRYIYTAHFARASEGGYVVTVPALPGCYTFGATYEEAFSHAKEAILGFVEALRKKGRPIPVEEEGQEVQLEISLPIAA